MSKNPIPLYLEAFRRKLNMTQYDLAVMLGVSQNYISYYENELAVPSDQILEQIANIFGCDVNILLQPAIDPNIIS